MTFASLGLPAPILKGIRAAGLSEPTAIQSKSIPSILEGNDLIAAAQSGTGKTASYILPILARLIESTSPRLRALVLAPTREMAAYVETRARDYARFTRVRVGVVFTGAPLAAQERMLREQPVNLLVATPGRLLELHARDCLNFEDVELLVLEEADRMVALGLAPDLRKLLKLLPETRQTLLFSLTMPPELNRLAKDALIEPMRVDMAPPTKPAAGITQAIYPVPRDLKSELLDEMLSRSEVRSTIVFTRTRTSAERLARLLQRRGYAAAVLDEHPSQNAREQALDDLRRGRAQILVASDASARSLDVTGLAHVWNFDVPQAPEDYVHRLGRAGRADPVGDAFTLMSPEEQKDADAIERFLGRTVPRVMLPDFDYEKRPSELRTAAVEGDKGSRRAAGGLPAAAGRIASLARPTAASAGRESRAQAAAPARGATPARGSAPGGNGPRPRPSRPKSRPARPARGGTAAPRHRKK